MIVSMMIIDKINYAVKEKPPSSPLTATDGGHVVD
jgi:hypothetical protein